MLFLTVQTVFFHSCCIALKPWQEWPCWGNYALKGLILALLLPFHSHRVKSICDQGEVPTKFMKYLLEETLLFSIPKFPSHVLWALFWSCPSLHPRSVLPLYTPLGQRCPRNNCFLQILERKFCQLWILYTEKISLRKEGFEIKTFSNEEKLIRWQ